ncbi:hypothetical protein [Staphylococcus virus vB_SurM-PSU5]|nr:hypothetical protein [Staphylococcus virus vB_SurM-PSU5]
MVKIKTKKKLNLSQLIEYAWDNGITNKEYICDGFEIKSVVFNLSGWAEFSDEFSYNPHDTFTVEEETEITEDTWFPKLVSRTVSGNYHLWKQGSINDFKYLSFNDLNAFYIPNDDLTMTLIWRDGKLVE